MDQTLIERWNQVIPVKGAEVYVVGDMFLCPSKRALEIFDQLNGRIFLVRGNHDKKMTRAVKDRFVWIKERCRLKVREDNNQEIILDHYAGRTWDKAIHGSWQLYGHSHGKMSEDPNLLSFEVGVDCHDFFPLSYIQVKERMLTKKARISKTLEEIH